MKYRVNRGIALLMVMLVVVLVSILTGAFLTINRTNLFLLGSAKDKAIAYEGCQSALEFAQAQLGNDFTWGTTAFANKVDYLPSSADPLMEVHYSSTGKVDTNKI